MTSDGPATLSPAPRSLVDAAGAPRLGAFAGGLERLDLAALAPGLRGLARRIARAKRWTYLLAASDAALVGAAIVEAGWFAGAFVWAVDRATGAVVLEASAAGLPGLSARVNDRPGAGARARFRAPGLALRIDREGDRWTLAARAAAARVDVVLDAVAAPPPFTLVAPVPGGGVRATQKAGGLAASGGIVLRGRALSLEGGTGGVDSTAGLLARRTDWRWAFGTGRAAGAPLAFNLCEGNGLAADDPGENARLAPGPARLPPVSFAFDPLLPLAPWRVASAGGEVALVFTPQAVHREARDLGLVATRFAQVAGTFDGVVPGPGGDPIAVRALPGVVEDHRARW